MSGAAVDYDAASMTRLPVDAEHLGIRIAVPLFAIVAFIVVLWLGPILFSVFNLADSVVGLVVLPLAIAAAIGGSFLADRVLKSVWPSGRELLVDEHYLVFRQGRNSDIVLTWDDRVNALCWRFTISRRGRVPKGYFCLALQFIQDEDQITAYTFYNPQHIDELQKADAFTPLVPRKSLEDDRLSMRVAAQQRRLLQAENDRWESGAELEPDDFVKLWQIIQEHHVEFQQ
jgi:hypothetical protein